MARTFEQMFAGAAVRFVETSRRHPRRIVVACLALTAVAAQLVATRLEVDTNPDLMTSSELPFHLTNEELRETFPDLQHNLVVLVEADDPADARAAVEELAEALGRDPERFAHIFLPGDDPYYDDFGLYYIDLAELEKLAARIDDAGPLLVTLAEEQDLSILVAAITHLISDIEGLAALGDDGGRILDEVAHVLEESNRGRREAIDWGDLLFEEVEHVHEDPQVLFVRPSTDLTRLNPALEAIRDVRAAAGQLEPRPGLRVRVTGDRAVHTEEMSLVMRQVAVAGTVSLLLVTLILLYGLQSFRLLFATVLTLVVGLVWTAGFAAAAVGHLNVLTTAFAVLYIGLGVDFGIHFALGYLEQRSRQRPPDEALRDTGHRVGSSLIFCALTTAIGFYAFIPTSYTGVVELGIISGTGIFLSLLATLTWYPALISMGMGESPKLGSSRIARMQLRLPTFPLRHPKWVCGAGAALAVASAFSLGWVRFDMDPLNVRDPRVESVQAMEDLLAEGEISAWTIEVLVDDLDSARRLEAALEADPDIHRVLTLESFLPEDVERRRALFEGMRAALSSGVELSDEERGAGVDPDEVLWWTIEGYGVALDLDAELRDSDDDPLVAKSERLRAALEAFEARLRVRDDEADDERKRAALDRALANVAEDVFGDLATLLDDVRERLPARAVTLGDLPESLARRYVSDRGRYRVEVFTSLHLREPGALEAFTEAVQSVDPTAGGAVVGTVELGRAIKRSLGQALASAVVVIAVLLLILWRSVRLTAITLAPLGIGALATTAFTVVADVPFNFANVIVLPLILGIGVDSGIHLVHRHRTGVGSDANVLHTSTARAVIFSAFTTVASFATLAVSDHMGMASLARLLTAGIVFMLLANVIVLPALLELGLAQAPGDRRSAAPSSTEPAAR